MKLGDKLKQVSANRRATNLPKGCYDTVDGMYHAFVISLEREVPTISNTMFILS